MSTDLVLYTNPMSRGRIARWMLEETGADYRVEVLEYESMKSPAYLDVNPMGKVPAIRHGDVVVTEAAAICAYLADAFPEAGLAPPEIRRGLEREGGLLGLSGISSDFRRLTEATRVGEPSAALALEVFVHRIRRYLGSFLVQVGPCDGVVFSGGIGENSPEVRRKALDGLESLGLVLDPTRNEGVGERRISTDESPIAVWVIPTDEESLIARDTARLVG